MSDKITKNKIEKYYEITKEALALAKNYIDKTKNINKHKKKQSDEIFLIVESYLSDSIHFKEKNDFVNSFACLNYAHGWLDCGARLEIYKVKDNKLFSV